jgi:hypothetical protein
LPSARTEILDRGGDSPATIRQRSGVTSSSSYCRFDRSGFQQYRRYQCAHDQLSISVSKHARRCYSTPLADPFADWCDRHIGATLGILRNMFVPSSSRAMRLGRIDIVSERGRWRSREQATTTTTATREPFAGLTFFVEDMERRQADIGNFLLAERHFMTDCGVACRRIWSRPRYRHSTRQRQRQSGRSQNRYGFAPLRRLLYSRHLDSPGQERLSS